LLNQSQEQEMENGFTVPPELRESLQRLLPYMAAGTRNDPKELEAVYFYLKIGGEKLARIAIDAFNQTHRLRNAQMQKMRLEQALISEPVESGEVDEGERQDETEAEEEDGVESLDDDEPVSDF
jgi:hypothetical protein